MLKFIKWNPNNPLHIEMAENCQSVIFLDDGLVRYGYFYCDYHGNGYTSYVVRHDSGEIKMNYNSVKFLPFCEDE